MYLDGNGSRLNAYYHAAKVMAYEKLNQKGIKTQGLSFLLTIRTLPSPHHDLMKRKDPVDKNFQV